MAWVLPLAEYNGDGKRFAFAIYVRSTKKGSASFSCCPGDGDTAMRVTDDVDPALSFSADWRVGNTCSGPSQTTQKAL